MTPLLCGCIVIWKGTARSIEGPRLPWALHTPVWYVGLACPCLVFQQESHACVVYSTPCDVRVADATAVVQFFFLCLPVRIVVLFVVATLFLLLAFSTTRVNPFFGERLKQRGVRSYL